MLFYCFDRRSSLWFDHYHSPSGLAFPVCFRNIKARHCFKQGKPGNLVIVHCVQWIIYGLQILGPSLYNIQLNSICGHWNKAPNTILHFICPSVLCLYFSVCHVGTRLKQIGIAVIFKFDLLICKILIR